MRSARFQETGVVVQDVDAAEGVDRGVDECTNRCAIRDVCANEGRHAAGLLDRRDRLAAARLVDVGDDDAGPALGEQLGGRAADAGAGAGHDDDGVSEVHQPWSRPSTSRNSSNPRSRWPFARIGSPTIRSSGNRLAKISNVVETSSRASAAPRQ